MRYSFQLVPVRLEGLLRHNAHCAAFGGTFLESAVEVLRMGWFGGHSSFLFLEVRPGAP